MIEGTALPFVGTATISRCQRLKFKLTLLAFSFHYDSIFRLGYGMDSFGPTGSCNVAVSAKAFVSVKTTTPGTFTLAANPFPPAVTAGYICEKESKCEQ